MIKVGSINNRAISCTVHTADGSVLEGQSTHIRENIPALFYLTTTPAALGSIGGIPSAAALNSVFVFVCVFECVFVCVFVGVFVCVFVFDFVFVFVFVFDY